MSGWEPETGLECVPQLGQAPSVCPKIPISRTFAPGVARVLQVALLASVVAVPPVTARASALKDVGGPGFPRPVAAAPSFNAARMSGSERAAAGKGAWFMIFASDWTDSDPARATALAQSAAAADVSHLYVRVADSRAHFYAATALADLLPAAHRVGLAVLGWIEPTLADPERDAADAVAAAEFAVEGQRLDGLALTVEETPYLTDPYIDRYLRSIRMGSERNRGLGDAYLLIGSSYPLPSLHATYGYASMSRWCQLLAPLAYWRATGRAEYSDDPGTHAYIRRIFREFASPAVNPFGRPLTITAQAYDAEEENGTPGAPPASEIVASLDATRAQGGFSWSFYRLADADNGVTADETAAIAAYGYWRRGARTP